MQLTPLAFLEMAMFVLFVGLKLTGNIDWSWWWVTAPLWLGLAIGVSLRLLSGIIEFFTKGPSL